MWSYAGVQIAVQNYANASGQCKMLRKTNAQKKLKILAMPVREFVLNS